ncbi:MAG TPA: HAMP domain-containing sensor histidine kinase [Ideonella sp.]|nr:HAMP domain-containing sensor histidine kinase [Ideonella sp.]
MALHIALALALIETLALAGVLFVWADRVAGARLLVGFLLGVAVWIVGNELPNWFGPQAIPLALSLLATVSTTAAVFLHFCVVFCGVALRRRWLVLAYAAGVAGTLTSLLFTPGHFEPFAGIAWVPMPNWAGWVTSSVWVVLAAAGVAVLARALLQARGQALRQVAAVAFSCGWGLACMSGYGIAALQLPYYPWPLLGVPAYPLMLVYGILRYRVFVANAWARRALVWAILLGLGLLAVPLTLLLPVASRWISGAAVALTCLALNGPVRRFAERLVYPGGVVSPADLAGWRTELAAAESLPALAVAGSALLSQRVGLAVEVCVETGEPTPALSNETPTLRCRRGESGWGCELLGWDSAPPGPRHVAEFFGAVLAEAAAQVERSQQREQRERERQLQARLAELGSLAATVAHDLRNPLNIIAMAVAGTPAETRREVAEQVGRISRLAADLLDYAKPWQLAPAPLDLAQRLRDSVRRMPEVVLGAGLDRPLPLLADAARIDQVLANLLANARAAAGERPVHIEAERAPGTLRLHVCDDGPGVPAELRERLFQPFASRSPGGTGLGLAIVARIMAAHGGSVALTERPPWRTCFTLSFPAPP